MFSIFKLSLKQNTCALSRIRKCPDQSIQSLDFGRQLFGGLALPTINCFWRRTHSRTLIVVSPHFPVKPVNQFLPHCDTPSREAMLLENTLKAILEAVHELKPVLLEHGLELFLLLVLFLLEHSQLALVLLWRLPLRVVLRFRRKPI